MMTEDDCPECNGRRLNSIAMSIKINKKSIADVTDMSVESIYNFFNDLKLTKSEEMVAESILKEIQNAEGGNKGTQGSLSNLRSRQEKISGYIYSWGVPNKTAYSLMIKKTFLVWGRSFCYFVPWDFNLCS